MALAALLTLPNIAAAANIAASLAAAVTDASRNLQTLQGRNPESGATETLADIAALARVSADAAEGFALLDGVLTIAQAEGRDITDAELAVLRERNTEVRGRWAALVEEAKAELARAEQAAADTAGG